MSLKITTNPTSNENNEIYEGLLTHNLHYIHMELATKEKGAKYAEVDTFSFQALPFYQKQGFEIFGMLENYPISDKKYHLRKDL